MMRSSVSPSVAPSVPASTGPGASPAYTSVKPVATFVTPAATTGEAAGAPKDVPNGAGEAKTWYSYWAQKVGWKPTNPKVNQGVPAPLPPGQHANWVQGPAVSGTVESDMPPGRADVSFGTPTHDWTRTKTTIPVHRQSYDVTSTGFIQEHAGERQDFWIMRGAEDPDNKLYWMDGASQLPDVTPLAVIPGPTTPYASSEVGGYAVNNGAVPSMWRAAGVNSGYNEPAPGQPTSSPDPTYQPDPALEWL
jgi:hypothetical protein